MSNQVKVLKINPSFLKQDFTIDKKKDRTRKKRVPKKKFIETLQQREPKRKDSLKFISEIVNKFKKSKNHVEIKKDPPYGNLKSGKKPTLSQYRKTLKQQKPKQEEYVELPSLKFNNELKLVTEKPRHNKTMKKCTFNIGKSKKNISVLIKNNKTRKMVDEQIEKFKQIPMYEIRKYLKDRNIIKSGSQAPDFILRKMFLDMLCSGEIYNRNGQWLMHNYMNDDQPTLEIGDKIDYKIDIELIE